MNDELQKQLTGLLEAARVAGSDAATFIQQQAPELCEQLIRWKTLSSATFFALWSTLTVTCLVWTYVRRREYDVSMGGSVSALLAVLSLMPLHDLVKVLTAPKLVLLEEIAKLLQ